MNVRTDEWPTTAELIPPTLEQGDGTAAENHDDNEILDDLIREQREDDDVFVRPQVFRTPKVRKSCNMAIREEPSDDADDVDNHDDEDVRAALAEGRLTVGRGTRTGWNWGQAA